MIDELTDIFEIPENILLVDEFQEVNILDVPQNNSFKLTTVSDFLDLELRKGCKNKLIPAGHVVIEVDLFLCQGVIL